MNTEDKQDAGPIPAGLVREAPPATETPTPAAETAKAADAVVDAVAKSVARNRAKLSGAVKAKKVKAEAKPAAEPKAKKAKPAAEPKAKKAKPADVKATNDNPRRSIVPERFKAIYAQHNDTNGTPLALALKDATTTRNADGRVALDVAALEAIAKENGIDFAKYSHLNNGQKRMNVSNKLAGKLKAGEKVTVGKRAFANAGKALAKPQAEAQAA